MQIDPGAQDRPSAPFLDDWTYFLCDLFRITKAEVGIKGRNLFWDYLYTALLLEPSHRTHQNPIHPRLKLLRRKAWCYSGP